MPACSSRMAVVCRSMCAVIVLPCSDGQSRGRGGGVAGRGGARSASRLSRLPRRVGNSGWSGLAAAFGEPGAQHGDGAGGERGDPLLAALAVAGDVRAGAEVDVARW